MPHISHYAHPTLLWLLLLLLPMVAYYLYRLRRGRPTLTLASVAPLKGLPRSPRYYLQHLPIVLRLGAFALLVVALARPQSSETLSHSYTEGIDIVLALDVSTSMLAQDFKPNRLEASKEVAARFLADRPNDRIGLVVFAGESFTQSPLTTDKATLLNLLSGVRTGLIEDGTAMGSGLATAVNRLRESDAESRVIILLTDGVNNRGQIAPEAAAEIAQSYGIRIYTIGVGSEGMAPYPVVDMFGRGRTQMVPVEIDEQILAQVAEATGGRYFRATDRTSLEEVYEEINTLERSKVEVDQQTRYDELFGRFLLIALVLLLLEWLVARLLLRQIP